MTQQDEVMVKPDILYTVNLIWKKKPLEYFADVVEFAFDEEMYFFYIWDDNFPDKPVRKTVWAHNPSLLSIEISPYRA